MVTRWLKQGMLLLATSLGVWLLAGELALADKGAMFLAPAEAANSPFAPSNARTSDQQFIPVSQFFPAARCQKCHQDTHQGWSQSLHRNAAREPFYRESADILLKTRGIELTRHCESCHTPVALFSGALSAANPQPKAPFTKMDDEGVTCSVCHSITDARLDGTGSYTIRRPSLLAQEDGTPIYGEVTDEQILADIPAHKRAVMRPLLKQPEFCATCHKVDAPPALNNYKHIRGFSAYDEWQQSGASQESLLSFYRREQRADCRACHMPKVESRNDRAAKPKDEMSGERVAFRGASLRSRNSQHPRKYIASHRWLGANTAAPLFYGQQQQVEQTKAFLQANVAEVDIFALRKVATGELLAPLTPETAKQIVLKPGEEVIAEVVVSNRNAAHSFPPEVRDLYEPWVELLVTDAAGKTLFHSGFLHPDGTLDESAHVYKTILLDEAGRYITRHQIWTTTIKAYDNTIGPGRSDVVRYRIRMPDIDKGQLGTITLRAKLNYRRFNQEYTHYIQKQQKKAVRLPIVLMAEATVQLGTPKPLGKLPLPPLYVDPCPEWKRWNDYGIGLLEQSQFGLAALAFRYASSLAPGNPDLFVNAALAELRTERYADHERPQLQKAAALLQQALQLPQSAAQNPTAHWRARYYRALIWRAEGKPQEAFQEFQELARLYPRDREVQRQFAQTAYALGNLSLARRAFESIVALDPTDFGAYQFLSPLYTAAGLRTEAQRADTLYQLWREDPRADGIAAKFFIAHPEWADERVPAHWHGKQNAQRPVLTGTQATPVK
jgi:tetratricopeptide (TPR) repeat protein